MTVLVLGSRGQLAQHLRETTLQATFWGRETLDIGRTAGLERAIAELCPSVIVNAAAYTAVDAAETHPADAWQINVDAVAAAARAAEALGVPLVHVSTDYVFAGTARRDYEPEDATSPLSVYGRTKLAGELAVRTLCSRHWILRVSWVFSEHGQNFVKTMLRLGAERRELRVVADQRGRPTYAGSLAELIAKLINPAEGISPIPFGTYHPVGGPALSWCEFAETIFERAQILGLIEHPVKVEPIPTEAYPTPARRPLNAVLGPSTAVTGALGCDMDWRLGLDKALSRLVPSHHSATGSR